ncbi:MAG: hypothetical protein GY847_34930, partial [Proteobacteria bacterium]|nr:hypothetical protein [Pseudomonadota bacterium]
MMSPLRGLGGLGCRHVCLDRICYPGFAPAARSRWERRLPSRLVGKAHVCLDRIATQDLRRQLDRAGSAGFPAGSWAKPTYASIVLLPRICAGSS